ncbi:MAG: adenylate cyclase [Clostridiales bacterium]|nr:adenylate cyclase [Clostridiales bacterium]MDN5281302.1 adenylate cyclase [Candidatus Ozemobacter sp.]
MSEQKARILTSNVSDLGKRAFFVLIFTLLPAMFAPARSLLAWIDAKATDLFFIIRPYFKEEPIDHPGFVIVKDQTFFQRFGRDPNRSDFARLLKSLESGKVDVAAIDFIYDSPTNPETDNLWASALNQLPFTILAEHFVTRGRQTFEKADFADQNSLRPPWPLPLFPDFAKNAAAKGLINILSDYDSTVRYAPLAFLPVEKDEFQPTLGYCTYIAWLFNKVEPQIKEKILKYNCASAPAFLDQILEQGPFSFNSSGHAGIDRMNRHLERKFMARLLGRYHPQFAEIFKETAENQKANLNLKTTWLNLPKQKLPIIGAYEMPCLRINFHKAGNLLNTDGIESFSMGLLLETQKDHDYANRFYKPDLSFSSSNDIQQIPLAFTWQEPGNAIIKGKIIALSQTDSDTCTIRVEMLNTAYWEETKPAPDGTFILSNMPCGKFVINVIFKNDKGWTKSSFSGQTATATLTELPPLYRVNNFSKIGLPDNKLPENARISFFGEALNLFKTDNSGKINLEKIPSGFSLIPLDDAVEIATFSDQTLLNVQNQPIRNKVFALLSDQTDWNHNFFYSFRPKDAVFLPTSLDCRIAVFLKNQGKDTQHTLDLQTLPGEINPLDELPEPTRTAENHARVNFVANASFSSIMLIDETENCIRPELEKTLNIPTKDYKVFATRNKLKGRFNRLSSLFRGRAAFIGTALQEDQDFIVTPINFLDSGFTRLPGVHLHANLFSGLARQDFLKPMFLHSDQAPILWPLLQILSILPLLVLANLIFARFGAIWGGASILLLCTCWAFTSFILFLNSIIFPTFFPILNIASFGVIRGYLAWAISRRKEKETRTTFGRFISSAIVEEILKTPESLKPGGEKKELTVMFTDLAGFTTISEKLEPEQLTELMNEYLGEMTSLLFRYGGTLDKYIGDAIMAFWNHPKSQSNHAELAAECAIAMQKKLAELREKWLSQGLPEVKVRAGINTANCMVGFIGSDIQMNFTCLGDGVNLASRLEGANKPYDTLMMISEAVHSKLDPEKFSTRFLDYLAVKGKAQPIKVYELRGYRHEENSTWLEAEKFYNLGIKQYLERNWEEAIESFSRVIKVTSSDSPSQIYIERCKKFSITPPPENWDGRFTLTTK